MWFAIFIGFLPPEYGLVTCCSLLVRLVAGLLDPWNPTGYNGSFPLLIQLKIQKDRLAILQSLMALGSGELLVSLGRSRQKFFYLPEPHTDYIFSIIGEELGLLGALLVLLLFLGLAWRGYKIALSTSDPYGSLLAVGITSWLVMQALINIAVVTATIPATGITLPLLSYGGSSLGLTMAAVGVLLNISRQTNQAGKD